ncbi:hypothetical protein K523DRAFT_146470 [Schizophyllum commune Tattone D]|nr:hypothetical protein K523DRAFT_146470 [Schizophyllum commune Tattone D]
MVASSRTVGVQLTKEVQLFSPTPERRLVIGREQGRERRRAYPLRTRKQETTQRGSADDSEQESDQGEKGDDEIRVLHAGDDERRSMTGGETTYRSTRAGRGPRRKATASGISRILTLGELEKKRQYNSRSEGRRHEPGELLPKRHPHPPKSSARYSQRRAGGQVQESLDTRSRASTGLAHYR